MEKDDRGPYGTTLVLESLLSVFRFFPAIFPAALIGLLIGIPLLSLLGASEDSLPPLTVWIAVFLALAPVIASVLSLTVLPGGYGLTRRELGARKTVPREEEELLEALQELVAVAPSGTIAPSRWLVFPDAIDPNAFVIGTAIYIHSGLFGTPYLLPVLAHELGHLNHGDGRLVLALRRLVPPPFSYLNIEGGGCLPLILKLCGGGFGLTLMTPAWNSYWQQREFLADRFAFECGQADGVIDLLERYRFFDAAVPFHAFRSEHPYHDLRISRLQEYLEEEANAPVELIRTERTRDSKAGPLEPKREFTDAEVVLDLDILDEGHAGWVPPELIPEETAWIRANGRRIVDLARQEQDLDGRGVVSIVWTDDRDQGVVNNAFHYIPQDDHAEYLNDPTIGVRQQFDSIMGAALQKHAVTWQQHVATYSLKDQVIVMVTSLDRQTRQYGTSHFLLDIRPGGAGSNRVTEAPTQGEVPDPRVRTASPAQQRDNDLPVAYDLVILDETYPNWAEPQKIKEEKAWIQANGRRFVELARAGHHQDRHGVVYLERDDRNQYEPLAPARYYPYAKYGRTLESFLDQQEWSHWVERHQSYDPERTFLVAIGATEPEMELGFSYYLVGVSGGGTLPGSG